MCVCVWHLWCRRQSASVNKIVRSPNVSLERISVGNFELPNGLFACVAPACADEMRDGFAVNILCQQFGFACVSVLREANHVTTKDSRSEAMVSEITGGRRYSFNLEGGSNLFQGCTTDSCRHSFVSSSRVAGPNVFHGVQLMSLQLALLHV